MENLSMQANKYLQISSINGFKLNLEFITDKNLPLICKWRNAPEVRQFMDDTREVNVAVLRVWLAKVVASSKMYAWIIRYKNTPIGFYEIKNIDYTNRTCEEGIFFDKDFIGKGLGIYLGFCREIIFQKINIDVLISRIHIQNFQAIRYQEFLGLKRIREENNTFLYMANTKQRHEQLQYLASRFHLRDEWDFHFHN